MGRTKPGGQAVSVLVALRKAKRDGWVLYRRTAGNHRQLKHPTKKGRVTIAGNPGDELDQGTLKSIQRQMQVTPQQWNDL